MQTFLCLRFSLNSNRMCLGQTLIKHIFQTNDGLVQFNTAVTHLILFTSADNEGVQVF